jgi:hypothetical protein
MEDVLDLSAEPDDLLRPLVCVDERPYQLLVDLRPPLPSRPDQPARGDYEDERRGTCNLFVFFLPSASWHHLAVTERRTAPDFARQLQYLVDERFPDAELVRVVVDNLNLHSPAEARRLARKLEFHYTASTAAGSTRSRSC